MLSTRQTTEGHFTPATLKPEGNLHTLFIEIRRCQIVQAKPMRSIKSGISAIFPLPLGVRRTVKSSTAVVVPMINQSGNIGSLKLHSEVLRRNLPELCQKRSNCWVSASSEKPLNMPLAIDFLMNSALPPVTVTQRPFNGFVSGHNQVREALSAKAKDQKRQLLVLVSMVEHIHYGLRRLHILEYATQLSCI